jgi:DNA polymerase-3 subunit alpha
MHSHSDYVSLHLHTENSLLDGAIRIKELIEMAKAYKMPALTITDHGNLFGAVEFYKQVSKAGVKPIIGCEVYVAPGSRFDKRNVEKDGASFHLILLARDNSGYRNLVTLVTKAYLEGFYYRPRIDMDLLEQFSGGLIGLSACLKGEIPFCLQRGLLDRAREKALEYKHIFGPENFYIEIQDNGLTEQAEANKKLINLARELHIGIVATNDCHYLNRQDAKAHDILLSIQTGKTLKDENRLKFNSDEFYFKSPEEMKKAFEEIPEAISNTIAIAERCNVGFKLGESLLPQFGIEGGEKPYDVLSRLAYTGLEEKFAKEAPQLYKDRLMTELDVIKRMGYASYFLIVWDFISYARGKGIPVGPGRGSAAGSLVSYCLDITEIDPIKYNLLFERFLNPERISMPDIDVDFCQDRRPEVIS